MLLLLFDCMLHAHLDIHHAQTWVLFMHFNPFLRIFADLTTLWTGVNVRSQTLHQQRQSQNDASCFNCSSAKEGRIYDWGQQSGKWTFNLKNNGLFPPFTELRLNTLFNPTAIFNVFMSHLWPWVAMSMALRTGTGDPPSMTHSTSMDFLSGLRLPCRLSIGESTRFLGGSAEQRQVEGQQRDEK